MTRRTLILIIAAFLVTRVFLLWDASRPLNVGAGYGDMTRYTEWASQVVGHGMAPYSQVAIEYPPGILPVIAIPHVVTIGGDEYRERFVLLMFVLDAVGLVGVLAISRRLGTSIGPWLWIAGVVLLGPIVYLRLDMIPAVATIWAMERTFAGAARTAGGIWGFAILSKLYPALLLPAVVIASRRRKQLIAGVAVTIGLVLVGFVGVLDDLWHNVLGYHRSRGIQLESTWAMFLLAASRRGYEVIVNFGFGAYEMHSTVSETLKKIATAVSVATLGLGTWAIARRGRDDHRRLALGVYGLMAALLGVGTVLSPQFLVWLIALGAVALCFNDVPLRWPVLAVLPIAALTQLVFPYWYEDIRTATARGVLLLAARNIALIGVGTAVLMDLWNRPADDAAPTEGAR